jgi:hypothetical protein
MPNSPRLSALLACACAEPHEGRYPFWGYTISPADLALEISAAVANLLFGKDWI